jgi:hypothetical protein
MEGKMNTHRPESGSQSRSGQIGPPWVIYVHQDLSQDSADSIIDEASRVGQPIKVEVLKSSARTEVVQYVLARALDKDVTVTFEIVSGANE